MEKYKIEIKESAVKELDSIPRKDLKKIVQKIRFLSDNPRPNGCVKLSGRERYRIRQGDYRILYSIENEILVVYVIKIGHRKEVYR